MNTHSVRSASASFPTEWPRVTVVALPPPQASISVRFLTLQEIAQASFPTPVVKQFERTWGEIPAWSPREPGDGSDDMQPLELRWLHDFDQRDANARMALAKSVDAFEGTGVGSAWHAKAPYAAILLTRSKDTGRRQATETHRFAAMIEPVRADLGVYSLQPVFWSAAERLGRSSGDLKLMFRVRISACWLQNGAPSIKPLGDFVWVLDRDVNGTPSTCSVRVINSPAQASAALVMLPLAEAVLCASVKIGEVSSSLETTAGPSVHFGPNGSGTSDLDP